MNEISNLCYNVPEQSIYGEIVASSIYSILIELQKFSKNKDLVILDIGSGSGLTLLNLATFYHRNNCILVGIEVSEIRANISKLILFKNKLPNIKKWDILQADILSMNELPNNIKISYHFDKTFTKNLMNHIVNLENQCTSLKYVITFHSKKYYKEQNWIQVIKKMCRLKGSKQALMCYAYLKRKN